MFRGIYRALILTGSFVGNVVFTMGCLCILALMIAIVFKPVAKGEDKPDAKTTQQERERRSRSAIALALTQTPSLDEYVARAKQTGKVLTVFVNIDSQVKGDTIACSVKEFNGDNTPRVLLMKRGDKDKNTVYLYKTLQAEDADKLTKEVATLSQKVDWFPGPR